MINDSEKDPILGKNVQTILKKLGIDHNIKNRIDQNIIKKSIEQLIKGLGLELEADLLQTPSKVSAFMQDEMFYGLNYDNFPKISLIPNTDKYQEPIFARQISFNSTCAHHLVNITGIACIAYIPQEYIVGFGKINRIVEFFAKRPQLQENATLQIFHTLKYILKTKDVAIIIKATHDCVTKRGVNDSNTNNITYQLSGRFKKELRSEVFTLSKID